MSFPTFCMDLNQKLFFTLKVSRLQFILKAYIVIDRYISHSELPQGKFLQANKNKRNSGRNLPCGCSECENSSTPWKIRHTTEIFVVGRPWESYKFCRPGLKACWVYIVLRHVKCKFKKLKYHRYLIIPKFELFLMVF